MTFSIITRLIVLVVSSKIPLYYSAEIEMFGKIAVCGKSCKGEERQPLKGRNRTQSVSNRIKQITIPIYCLIYRNNEKVFQRNLCYWFSLFVLLVVISFIIIRARMAV